MPPNTRAVPEHPEEETGFLPIRLELLLSMELAPCDLFRRIDEQFVVATGKAMPFGEKAAGRLRGLGVDKLFIRAEDAPSFFGGVRETLTALVRNPEVPARHKARAVHASCQEALRRVFIDPRAPFISQAREVLTPTIDLILDDHEATRHLIRLTAYDHATYVHSTNVGIFSLALGRIFLGDSAVPELRSAGAGFFLHDLGKCAIPLEILLKPASLSEEERLIVNRHPEDGWRMLQESGLGTEEAATIILQHHERDDGTGYPRGLTKDEIHPYARICRLADIYEALTSERPYHERRSTFQALKIMRDRVMTDADQEMLRHFIGLFGD